MELKNTTRELWEAYTSFNSQINQAEERISEIEDQLNEIKGEDKIREKRVKRNEQSKVDGSQGQQIETILVNMVKPCLY